MHNWLVLVALSVIFMQLLTTSEAKGRIKSLGERHYPLLARWRQVEVLILNEVFLSLRQEPRKPPPRLKSKPRPSASTKLIDPDLSSPLPSLAFQGGTIPVAPP